MIAIISPKENEAHTTKKLSVHKTSFKYFIFMEELHKVNFNYFEKFKRYLLFVFPTSSESVLDLNISEEILVQSQCPGARLSSSLIYNFAFGRDCDEGTPIYNPSTGYDYRYISIRITTLGSYFIRGLYYTGHLPRYFRM